MKNIVIKLNNAEAKVNVTRSNILAKYYHIYVQKIRKGLKAKRFESHLYISCYVKTIICRVEK